MTPDKLRVAVIGVGYLGKYHAEKYAALPDVELVAVCDADYQRAQTVAKALPGTVDALVDHHTLDGLVDAVSIAAPTPHHFAIALYCLQQGIHVLLEKPMTTTLQEADELIAIAQAKNLVLQIGHLERFNNAVKEAESTLSNPRFIESLRLAPFKLRGIDVNVILDLMIHDIDIIQSMVKSTIKHIAANGASVLSPYIDIANARLEFANGCVANVTASRVSLKVERKLRIFQHDCYIGMDLDNKKISIHRKGKEEMFPGIPRIISDEHSFAQGDALRDQIIDFIACIQQSRSPIVDGAAGRQALATAIEITQIVKNSNSNLPLNNHISDLSEPLTPISDS